jgi:F-type H+-transporting ATPase subunit a
MKGESTGLLEVHHWHPLKTFGFEQDFFALDAHTIIFTWLALGIIFASLLAIRAVLKKGSGFAYFVITNTASFAMDFIGQSLGEFSLAHFSFIGTLFIFIFLCNTLSLLPLAEEPTSDLNTTLALGILSFFYIQTNAIRVHGIKKYSKEFFTPLFLMFPLHVVGKLAQIVSISFRLFGNIFGSTIITKIWLQALSKSVIFEILGLVVGANLAIMLFFGLFEGFLQAFVFSMLSLTYLAIATAKEEEPLEV